MVMCAGGGGQGEQEGGGLRVRMRAMWVERRRDGRIRLSGEVVLVRRGEIKLEGCC